jgi:hypothetical protein
VATLYDMHTSPRSSYIAGTPQYGAEVTMLVEYDFDKMGGAVGDYILGVLPANSIVTQVEYILPTAFVGSGDVTTLGLAATGDTKLITDMSAVSADTLTSGTPAINNTTVSSHIKVTADTDIYFTIATAVVTAGRMVAFIRYINMPAS